MNIVLACETVATAGSSFQAMPVVDIVASLLTLALVGYGLRLVASPILGLPFNLLSAGHGSPPRPHHAGGPTLASFLAFAVVFRFVWHLQEFQTLSFEKALAVGAALIVGMAIVPLAERFVSMTAIVVFAIEDAVLDHGSGLLWFILLLAWHTAVRAIVRRS